MTEGRWASGGWHFGKNGVGCASTHCMATSESSKPRAAGAAPRYELLTLGDELLLGLTANGHLTWIGAQLGRRGILLQRNVTITDEADAIAEQFRESWAKADVVITTGGLGPTCDDRTRDVLAAALGQKLILDPAIEQAITERFTRINRKMTPNNLKQAYRFERGDVLPNANGTAPGLWVEQDGKVLIMLPGPPNELQPMFAEQVMPRLRPRSGCSARARPTCRSARPAWASRCSRRTSSRSSRATPRSASRIVRTRGRSTAASARPTAPTAWKSCAAIAQECAALLGDDFVCFGHDSLAKVVADQLRETGPHPRGGGILHGWIAGEQLHRHLRRLEVFPGRHCFLQQRLEDAPARLPRVPALTARRRQRRVRGRDGDGRGGAARRGFRRGDHGFCRAGRRLRRESRRHHLLIGMHAPGGDWSRKLTYPGPRGTVKPARAR